MSRREPIACACGEAPVLRQCGAYWSVYCDDCYDGAPDGHRQSGNGIGCDAAVRDWNEKRADEIAESAEAQS